jgi:hypothetical protein
VGNNGRSGEEKRGRGMEVWGKIKGKSEKRNFVGAFGYGDME